MGMLACGVDSMLSPSSFVVEALTLMYIYSLFACICSRITRICVCARIAKNQQGVFGNYNIPNRRPRNND